MEMTGRKERWVRKGDGRRRIWSREKEEKKI